MSRFLTVFTALFLSLTLAACAGFEQQSESVFSPRTLRSFNYQAVDALLKKADGKLSKQAPMLVSTISDVNNVEASSTFGRTVSEQVSARLAQKGYKVAELKLRQGISVQQGGLDPQKTGEFLLSRDVSNIGTEHKAAVALTGTYSVGARKVLVNLRLIDIRSGNVITGYDYEVNKTADIAQMTDGKELKPNYFSSNWAY